MFLMDEAKDNISILAKWIKESKCVAVITGAGVSKESGINTFRGKNGIYTDRYKGNSPEYLMSIYGLREVNETVREFFKNTILDTSREFKPNKTHEILTRLEMKNYIAGIITQNIDTLHQDAGSKNVIPIHGTLGHYYCMRCGQEYLQHAFINSGRCECGGFIRPDITLYGDCPNPTIYDKAWNLALNCDLLIVIGSSLTVNTVTDLLNPLGKSKDSKLVIMNIGETKYDEIADLVFNDEESCSTILERLEGLLNV